MINLPGSDLDLNSLAIPQSQNERERTELGQEEFLELMIAQLQAQDPFEPMENGEFISQLAEFGNVESLADMSASLDQLAESLYSSTALQASSMIGRSVLTEGNVSALAEGAPVEGAVELPVATGNAFVRITAPNGQVVRQFSLGNQGAGLVNFEWDGTTTEGTQAADGQYFISAGYTENGTETALPTLISTRVSSVSLSGGGTNTRITTETGQEISLSQVRAVM